MKLLFCTANPLLDIELLGDLEEVLRAINARDWQVVYLHDATLDSLKAYVRRHRPDIVHFAGHSSHDEITLVNPENQAAAISPTSFGQALRSGKPLKAVILSSCKNIAVFAALTDTAEWGIGTTRGVIDQECCDFTREFYTRLSENKDVPEAYSFACRRLAALERSRPKFYLLKMNGRYTGWWPVTMALIASLLVALAVMTFLMIFQRLSQHEQRLSQHEQRLSQHEHYHREFVPSTGNLGQYIEKLQGREYTADNDGFVVALAEGMFVNPGDPDRSGEFSVLLKTGSESLDYRFSVVGSGNRPTNLFGSVIVPVPRGSKWIAKGTAGFQGVDFKSFKVYWISQVDAALK